MKDVNMFWNNKTSDFRRWMSTHPTSGLSLMETMLTVGVFGLVAAIGARMMANKIFLQEHIETKGKVEDVRDLIRSSLDCGETFSNPVTKCDTGQFIEVLKSDSSTLIKVPDPSTVFGDVGQDLVEVRSKCSSGDGFYTMDMEYRRSSKGQVIRDKLTNSDYNWTNLFPVVPMTCPKTQCAQSTLAVTPTVVDFENIPGASENCRCRYEQLSQRRIWDQFCICGRWRNCVS